MQSQQISSAQESCRCHDNFMCPYHQHLQECRCPYYYQEPNKCLCPYANQQQLQQPPPQYQYIPTNSHHCHHSHHH
ncbi:unnamed protein product [Brachionus calyciflorus]|uniref:Uncharacterized protein n=1 Tax=Brachionus calyciflorus TaxID=104777 RepID=A0A814BKS7_9BILA|nr:unnamed protein product [Brachionus calyciflorus]